MKAVLNAGPIISLSKIKLFAVLKNVFDEILVPEAVSQEVLSKGQGKAGSQELEQAIQEGWIKTKKAQDHLAVRALQRFLGRGESEAIIVALEEQADFVVIDEGKARREAVRMGADVIGTLGVLKRAQELDLVKEDLKTVLRKLKRAGFRVSRAVEQDFLGKV